MDSLKTPLISIIVPVYNCEKFLSRCLNSLINQSYSPIEIIVIDDGSTDKSPNICDEFASNNFGQIRVIHKQNEGVSIARNVGLSMAKGSFIGFVDADDYVSNTFVEYLYELITKYQADMAVCEYVFVTDDEKIMDGHIVNGENEQVYNKLDALYQLCSIRGDFCGHSCDKLFRRDILENITFPVDIYIYEDLLFCIEAIYRYCDSVVFGRDIKYYYTQIPTSALHSKYTEKLLTAIKARGLICEKMEKQSNKEPYAVAKNAYYIEIMGQFIRLLREAETDEKWKLLPVFKKLLKQKIDYNVLSYKHRVLWVLENICVSVIARKY